MASGSPGGCVPGSRHPHTHCRRAGSKPECSPWEDCLTATQEFPPAACRDPLLHLRALVLRVASPTRFGSRTCSLKSNACRHATCKSQALLFAKDCIFIYGFLGGLAAMCKAELNSADQAPELLSLGQNSTTATFQCGVQNCKARVFF